MPVFWGASDDIPAAGKANKARQKEPSLSSILTWEPVKLPITCLARDNKEDAPKVKLNNRWTSESEDQYSVYIATDPNHFKETETSVNAAAPGEQKSVLEQAVEKVEKNETAPAVTKSAAEKPKKKVNRPSKAKVAKKEPSAQRRAKQRLLKSKQKREQEKARKKKQSEKTTFIESDELPNRYPFRTYLDRNPFERPSDTSASRDFQKPIFHCYGNGNTKPAAEDNYLRTFNVSTGRTGNHQADQELLENDQIFTTAAKYAVSPLRKNPPKHILVDHGAEDNKNEEDEEDDQDLPIYRPPNLEPLHGEAEKLQDELRMKDLESRQGEHKDAKIGDLLSWDLPYDQGYKNPTSGICEKVTSTDPVEAEENDYVVVKKTVVRKPKEIAEPPQRRVLPKGTLKKETNTDENVMYLKFEPTDCDSVNPRAFANMPSTWLDSIPPAGQALPKDPVGVGGLLHLMD
eukprot:g1000.t1